MAMGRIAGLAGMALLAIGCTRLNPAYEDGGGTSDPSAGEQGGPSTTGSAGEGIDGPEGGGTAQGSGDGVSGSTRRSST